MAGLELTSQQMHLLDAGVLIEQNDPIAAGEVGFAARLWAQLSLPYKNPGDIPLWTRRNGAIELVVSPAVIRDPLTGDSSVGYPFGVIPRYLLTWITTEAVRTQSKTLYIGGSLTTFLNSLNLGARGGVRGDLTRLHDQAQRLFGASIQVTDARIYDNQTRTRGHKLPIVDDWELWTPHRPGVRALADSSINLSQRFFDSIMESPFPVDLRALKALRGSPLRIDIYTWLAHRLPFVTRKTTIPWALLSLQFGSEYAQLHKFRAAFINHLRKVLLVYPGATNAVTETDTGLQIKRAAPAVPFTPRRRITN